MRRFFALFLFFLCLQQLVSPRDTFAAELPLLYPTTFVTPDLSASKPASFHLPLLLSEWTKPATASGTIFALEDYCVDVPIILYHHTQPLQMAELLGHAQLTVDSTIFDEQMNYLVEQGYTTLSAEDFVHALLQRQPLPEKSIVVTVDDAYDDNYTYAFMSAKKHKVIINFMIPTGLVNKPGYMMWDHLKEMKDNPYARIYNHTTNHAPLGLISDAEIDTELASSSAALKQELGLEPTIFTYPYGSFSDIAIEKVKHAGFIGALSTIEGNHQCASKVMTLERMHIGNAPLSFYGF